ncbi:uncharacterized protein VDAG_07392 [Verticillium dahliae VdLs.17]|uniref:Uncharacterized protein n=1 Tax=Verticillium dahliae (strain VdLs.17 / ATCC MYA-4575 / FGSC 10137) TaxID=498257 RepID=G2XAR1_VERDV|nr:uncharacterized protein VDAG_07392 [Verticillium dahliae VdLs.17]EGY16228.1 hypothetical protein VDAG_07392 [Verticillium dahliae VdLs.17]
MRFNTLAGAALAATSAVMAKELPKNEELAAELYDSGVIHEQMMARKMAHWTAEFEAGLLQSSKWPRLNYTKCVNGYAEAIKGDPLHKFKCKNLLTIKASDAPVRFSNDKDLTGHFADLPVGRSHNVVINEEANYGVAVGAAPRNGTCQAGLIFFDLTDPSKPTRLGCNGEDGYVHDAHCLIYRGPHKKYEGRDICYGYNEDTLTIYDVTDKANSKIISITSYEGATYTHQGWVLDVNNQEYLFLDDEIDEEESAGPAADGYPVTYIFDIRDLEHPKQTGLYKAAVRGIDHNQYIRDGLNFQSNYGAGVRVYDVSSVPEDPTGDSVCEVAFLDIYPEDDNEPGGGIVQYSGTWASYAQFDSGYIFINTIERGAFLAKLTKRERCKPKSCNADNCLRALRSSSVKGRLEESQEFCAGFLDGWNAQVTAVPEYAQKACPTNVISRVSSACSCLPTAAPTTA